MPSYKLEKSGVAKLKKEFLSEFLDKISTAKNQVDEVNEECQTPFSVRNLELMRQHLETGTKRVSYELQKLALLLKDLNESDVDDFLEIGKVMDKHA